MRIDSNNVNGNYGYHITRANQPHKKDENQKVQEKKDGIGASQADPNEILNALTAFGNQNKLHIQQTAKSLNIDNYNTPEQKARIQNNMPSIETLIDEANELGLSSEATDAVFEGVFA